MTGVVMNPGFSDHNPISVGFDYIFVQGSRNFKFLNCLAIHEEFDKVMQQCWRQKSRGTCMKNIWRKLRILKGHLKQLNKQEFSGVAKKNQTARYKLNIIQNKIHISDGDSEATQQERLAKIELEKWMIIEESV